MRWPARAGPPIRAGVRTPPKSRQSSRQWSGCSSASRCTPTGSSPSNPLPTRPACDATSSHTSTPDSRICSTPWSDPRTTAPKIADSLQVDNDLLRDKLTDLRSEHNKLKQRLATFARVVHVLEVENAQLREQSRPGATVRPLQRRPPLTSIYPTQQSSARPVAVHGGRRTRCCASRTCRCQCIRSWQRCATWCLARPVVSWWGVPAVRASRAAPPVRDGAVRTVAVVRTWTRY